MRVEPGMDATRVMWTEPLAINLSASGKILSTSQPNESFPIGSTPVSYVFEDASGRREFCNFTIVVLENGKTVILSQDVTKGDVTVYLSCSVLFTIRPEYARVISTSVRGP